MSRIAAFITPHGYGHAAIVTAVLDALMKRRPDLEVTLVTTVPEEVLRGRLRRPFAYRRHAGATDFGMLMASSTDIRVSETLAAYAAAHAEWPAVVAAEAAILRQEAPDLVLSCAGYACLAAAADLGIPAVAIGPFSWQTMLESYCGDAPEARPILQQMEAAYVAAEAFLALEPAVPTRLPNARSIGPVGSPQKVAPEDLRRRLGLPADRAIGLLAMGGISEEMDLSRWRGGQAVHWVVAGAAPLAVADLTPLEATGFSVSQAVAACDVVLTKPGYGTFVEAACGGTGILYRERADWPETAGLHRWAEDYVGVECIDSETFLRGDLALKLQKLLNVRRRPLAHPYGNEQAADFLERFL